MRVKWKARQLRLNRAARQGQPVTMKEVAKATGLALSRISEIENGAAEGVRFDTLIKLAEYYGVASVADLLEFEAEDGAVKTKPTTVAGKLRPAVGSWVAR